MYYFLRIASVILIILVLIFGLTVTAAIVLSVLHYGFGVQLPFKI